MNTRPWALLVAPAITVIACRTSPSVGTGMLLVSERVLEASTLDSSRDPAAMVADGAADDASSVSVPFRTLSVLELICERGVTESRGIELPSFTSPDVSPPSERVSFHGVGLALVSDAEPLAVVTTPGRGFAHLFSLNWRQLPDDTSCTFAAFATSSGPRYRRQVFVGEVALQFGCADDAFRSNAPLGEWARPRPFAMVPLRGGQVQLVVQCGAQVRSMRFFETRRPPSWCLGNQNELPASVREQVPCVLWERAHPMDASQRVEMAGRAADARAAPVNFGSVPVQRDE